MRRPIESRAGFALIEVLAALVITATLIAVALPFATHLLARWRTGQPDIDGADTWMQAIQRLSDDLAQAVPIVGVDGSPQAIGFRVASGSVKLIRPALGGGIERGLETVTYQVSSGPSGDMLVRYARPFVADRFGDEPGASGKSTILDGPFRLRFAALRSGDAPGPGAPPSTEMPAGVELDARALGRVRVPVAPIVLPIAARGRRASPQAGVQKEL